MFNKVMDQTQDYYQISNIHKNTNTQPHVIIPTGAYEYSTGPESFTNDC